MSSPDALELLFDKAKTGDEQAVDDFFYEVLELISLAQGIDISPFVAKATWFGDNPHVSKKGLAYSLLIPGFADSFYSKHGTSIERCNEASKIFAEIDYPDGVAMCAVVIGTNYRGLGNMELAIQYMTEAYSQLHKTDSNVHFTIASGHQLADLYAEAGNHNEALTMCQEVLPLAKAPANKKKMFDARLLNTTGNVYAKLGNNELAIEYFSSALKQSEELSQLPVTARVLTDMGGYYLSIEDYTQAIAYNKQALAIRKELNLRNPMITNIINIAKIYALQSNTDEAIRMLLTGYAITQELNAKARMLPVLKQLSALYEQKGDLITSLGLYKQYHTILEEQNKELQEQKIKNIKLFVDAEQAMKQNREIIKAQKEDDRKREEKKRCPVAEHPAGRSSRGIEE